MYCYGAGRVGLAVARLARARGVAVAGLWNPHPLRPERAALAEGHVVSITARPLAMATDLWLLTVPDHAIADVAAALADQSTLPRAAAHCAGAHPATLLARLAAAGVACGSWHPAMTFRGEPDDVAALADAGIALEGDAEAVALLVAFTDALGLSRTAVATERKALYHAALVVACNGRMALDAAAARLLASAGLDPDAAERLLRPLIARTEQNLRAALPGAVLTGPVARGDAETVRVELAALAGEPALLALYRALGTIALDLVPPDIRGEGHRQVAILIAERAC
ncbi:MAG: DUF2520 domain-containing protein [Gemmatimonadota bacterium]